MLRKINDPRFKGIIFLVFLVAVNLVVRFYKLAESGLWSTDEVAYYMLCRDAVGSFQNAMFSAPGVFLKCCGFYQTLQLLTGYPPKFGFYLVNSIALSLFNSQSTMLFVSAISSLLTALLVFLIGKKFFNFRIGVIASILFSFSLIYLRYSRNGFSLGITYFFLVLAVYYYLEFLQSTRLKSLILSGLSLGLSFLCHSQALLFFLVIIFLELLSSIFIYKKNLEEFLKRFTVFVSSFFLPLAILETTINIGRIFNCYRAKGYFREVLNTVAGNTALHQSGLIQPFYYIDLFWYLESPFIFILAVLSLPLLLKRLLSKNNSTQSVVLISGLFILPFLYWLLQRRLQQLDYNLLGAWPFLFLCIAIGFDLLFQKIRSRFLRVSAIIFFLIVSLSYSLVHIRTIFEIKNYYPQVSRVLKKYNIKKLIAYKTGGICGYSNIDPYLKDIQIYTADNLKEVYKIAREKGVEFCFYGSGEFFLAKTTDAVVEGEEISRIKDTTMRPHFPLFYMGLMNSGIQNTAKAEEFKDKLYDYMYLYKIKMK